MKAIFVNLLTFMVMVRVLVALSGSGTISATPCMLTKSEQGRITNVRLEAERAQYIVQLELCIVLVNASRWPLHAVGEHVLISGGSVRHLNDFSEDLASYRGYLARQGISAVWSYPSLHLRSGHHESDFFEGGIGLRRQLVTRLTHLFPEPSASIVSAMVLAERGSIPEPILEDFRHTGTAHVLAISGLHVGIIAGALWIPITRIPVPGWMRSVLIIVMLWTYIVFIGAPVSAQRAGLFISLGLIAIRLRLLISLPTVLFLTVATLLLAHPLLIYDVSFQLSFSAVAGIFLLLFLTRPYSFNNSTMQHLSNLFKVSLGAALGTGPLIALHFGIVSPVSVLANLAIVPPIMILVPLALLALGISFIFFPLALVLAWLSQLLIFWMTAAATFFARLPGAYFADVQFSLTWLPLYYLLIILLAHYIIKKQHRIWHEVWE
jgi:competence protein ComEC